tara:strand:+ start:47 stop:502 length:456 start_codon:yes stop_codon:yes gene_type:complete
MRQTMTMILGIALGTISSSVHATGEKWTSEFGQGVYVAEVKHGPGNSISVICGEDYGPGMTGIEFRLAGRTIKDSVFLIFDQEDPVKIWVGDGKITTECRACNSNYHSVLERLVRHDSVYVMDKEGVGTRFSLIGSSEKIDQDCKTDWAKF